MATESSHSEIRAAMADMVNTVTALRQTGQSPTAEALKNLAERIAGCPLSPQHRQEIIENLVFIGQQAQLLPERRKRGVIRAAFGYVKQTMRASEPLSDAWLTFGPGLESFFHL
jgi:hypothetical protein